MINKVPTVKSLLLLRHKAEEMLATKQIHAPEILAADTPALIHELQVHQIELELQNEELHKTQKILEISHTRFSDLYDCAPTGYLTKNLKGKIIEVNRTALEFLGYDKTELIGKAFTILVDRENLGILQKHVKHLRNGLPDTCEIQLTRKDASIFFAQLKGIPFVGIEGDEVIGELLIAIQDISPRKQIEEVSARLASIVEGSHDAIISVTLEGGIVSWNKGAEKTFGYTEEEVKGKLISILVPSDIYDETPRMLEKVRSGERVEHAETMRVRKDGSRIPVSFTVSPIMTSSGKVIGASNVASNITERKRWEESVLNLNSRLQISNRELETLGHVLSHDLRNPIRAIGVSAQLLVEEYSAGLGVEGGRRLRSIVESTKYLDEMVAGLLKISTISRMTVTPKSINLSTLVRLIASELRAKEPTRNVDFKIQNGVVVEGDESMVHMAVENLMRNAWQFTSKRSVALIEFGVVELHNKIAYYIRDNGAGFDMHFADRMFVVFERLHHQSEFAGTGMGLATVKRIISHHGGEVWAEGEIDKGATIYFTMP